MRLVAHLTDLHFGREERRVVEALTDDLLMLQPAVVAVSGDLTQRAREREFAASRDFLDRLPFPRVVVPGNHDLPVLDPLRRVLRPYTDFRRFHGDDELPTYEDPELFVVGVNTTRRAPVPGGRIARADVDEAAELLEAAPSRATRIVVAHHPFTRCPVAPRHVLVQRADEVLSAFAHAGLDVLLTGHLHRSFAEARAVGAITTRRTLLVVHGPTATSDRLRGEPNGYNLLRIVEGALSVEVRRFDGRRFRPVEVRTFLRRGDSWVPWVRGEREERPQPSP